MNSIFNHSLFNRIKKSDLFFSIVILLIVSAVLFALTGCKKDSIQQTVVKPLTPSISKFYFDPAKNANLTIVDTGIIVGDSITVELPIGTDLKSLTPTIIYDADIINPSANTALNFDTGATYLLKKVGSTVNLNTGIHDTNTRSYKVFIKFREINYASIDQTVKYATANDNSDLNINIKAAAIPIGKTRPLIIFTHGTGGSEQNALSIHSATAALVNQGFIVANFNFYGNDNTKNNNDGKHLYNQYPMVVDYLKSNAATYHINPDAIILCGASGSAAMAIHTALKKSVFGCMLECGGMVTGYTWDMPAGINGSISFAGVQTRSDNGFGGYYYTFADAESGASHNGNAYTENMGLRHYTGMMYDGDNQYCTAWGDAGLTATKNYLTNKYGASIRCDASYILVQENSSAHCPGGSDWNNFITTTPKKMLNDRGISW